jgi:hypothetical protein
MAREVKLPIHSEIAMLLQVDREPGMIHAQLAEQRAREPICVVGLIDSLQENALIETGGRLRSRPSAAKGGSSTHLGGDRRA